MRLVSCLEKKHSLKSKINMSIGVLLLSYQVFVCFIVLNWSSNVVINKDEQFKSGLI